MLPHRDSKLTRIFIAAFFMLFIGYAYYEVRGMIYGPHISLPSDVMQSAERFVTIQGTTERIATLRMNGAIIPVTEDGSFNEPYLLAPGLNRIVFDAEDKYGHSGQKVLQIVYTPSEEERATALPTSTPTSSTTTEPVAPTDQ